MHTLHNIACRSELNQIGVGTTLQLQMKGIYRSLCILCHQYSIGMNLKGIGIVGRHTVSLCI